MKLNEKMQKVGIEQAMRCFYDEEAQNEEPENEESEELVDLYEEFLSSGDFWNYLRRQLDISLIEFKMNKKLNEGIAMERAKNLRKRKERINKGMMRKYHVNDLKWLETCDEEQLDIIEELLYENISYEEIMRSVLIY